MEHNKKQTYRLSTRTKIYIIIVFTILVATALYFTFWRYTWISQSIQKGDVKTAALLFTPEIASSVASILYK